MSRPRWTEEELNRIYDSRDGYCYYCEKLSFHNYARDGEKGAWHVEHKVTYSKGGTDDWSNLAQGEGRAQWMGLWVARCCAFGQCHDDVVILTAG